VVVRLLQGNEAIALGAIKAGLGFYSSYPITPASEILHYIANNKKKHKIDFIQPEDELAAINQIIGASLAGKKSMTATSGPGFSLMQESIGYSYMTKIPIVIINSQRVGPSTGMPTLPSQGDVLQAAYGRHGDQQVIVFAPSSVEECYTCTIDAFNASEISQSPVILLSDALISHLYETIDIDKIKIRLIEKKTIEFGKGRRHFTGLLSKNNIPCTRARKYYREMFEKRKKQILTTAKKFKKYQYKKHKKSSTLLIGYGSIGRIISSLKEQYSIFRPIRLFPIIKKIQDIAHNYKRIIVIEMNDGQYKKEIERLLKRKVHSIPLLGGDYSLHHIKEQIKRVR